MSSLSDSVNECCSICESFLGVAAAHPMGWCVYVNDSVANIVLSMSTLLIALQLVGVTSSSSSGPQNSVSRRMPRNGIGFAEK